MNIPHMSCLVVVAMLFLSGCATSKPSTETAPKTSQLAILKTELRSLNITNPASDIETNLANKDFRFVGICGIVCYTPGIATDNFHLVEKYGVRFLAGTSDLIEGLEHEELMKTAASYAKSYNELLVLKLRVLSNP